MTRIDPSGCGWPNREARSSSALATRPGTSEKTRSAIASFVRRSRWASACSRDSGHLGPAGEPRREVVVAEAEQAGVGERGGGRGAGAGVEERQLAEHLARAEDPEQGLAAVVRGGAELDLAVGDDVQPVARLALGEQHAPAVEGDLAHRGAQRRGRLALERGEERGSGQRVLRHGAIMPNPAGPRSAGGKRRQAERGLLAVARDQLVGGRAEPRVQRGAVGGGWSSAKARSRSSVALCAGVLAGAPRATTAPRGRAAAGCRRWARS